MTNPESESWPGATCSGWSKRNSIHSVSKISWEEEEEKISTVEMEKEKKKEPEQIALPTCNHPCVACENWLWNRWAGLGCP